MVRKPVSESGWSFFAVRFHAVTVCPVLCGQAGSDDGDVGHLKNPETNQFATAEIKAEIKKRNSMLLRFLFVFTSLNSECESEYHFSDFTVF